VVYFPIAASITNNLRFPGQYFDAESGLSYNMMRDYDPTLGRYIQGDPIGLLGGINRFSYVKNAPMTFIDKRGLIPWGWLARIIGLAAAEDAVETTTAARTAAAIQAERAAAQEAAAKAAAKAERPNPDIKWDPSAEKIETPDVPLDEDQATDSSGSGPGTSGRSRMINKTPMRGIFPFLPISNMQPVNSCPIKPTTSGVDDPEIYDFPAFVLLF